MARDEFDDDYFRRLAQAREHWWVRGMQRAALALLPATDGRPLRVLDAGCGTGANIGWLEDYDGQEPVVGMDVAPAGLAVCRRLQPAARLVQASASQLPFGDTTFDLAVSTDVLQHLSDTDAAAAARQLHRVLRPGGLLLVRTNSSFGRGKVRQRDDWRLYTSGRLTRELTDAGLQVERVTAANTVQGVWASLPRPHRRSAAADHRHQTSGHTGHHGLGIPRPAAPWQDRLLSRVLAAEAAWIRRGHDLPVGHSLYALARRPL